MFFPYMDPPSSRYLGISTCASVSGCHTSERRQCVGDLGAQPGRDLHHFLYRSIDQTPHVDPTAYRRGWVTEYSFLKRNYLRDCCV